MNRYAETFRKLGEKGEAAFIPFAVAGDPDVAASEKIFTAYIRGGADILEIGYPFSDPIADGPVNQRASGRSIAAGLDHGKFFALIKRLRAKTEIPFGLLCYANTVLHLGYDRFCSKAAAAGLDSLLVADLPCEESGPLQRAMCKYGLGRVFIVSELTPTERMRAICSQVDSFVYVVSRLGTTGVDATLSGSVKQTLGRLKKVTGKPLAVGFGISTPDQVKAVCKAGADAAIVGSALVAVIESQVKNIGRLSALLTRRVAAYKAATR
jgi:tryptophan synthase alpha chain